MDVENHMVIGNDHNINDSRAAVEFDRELNNRISNTAQMLLAGGSFEALHNGIKISFGFDDVLVRAFEHQRDVTGEHPDYADCCREIVDKYPASKLAKLISHMAIVVATEMEEC